MKSQAVIVYEDEVIIPQIGSIGESLIKFLFNKIWLTIRLRAHPFVVSAHVQMTYL